MRVLVVEDEPKLAASLGEGLREAEYMVDLAANGEEALAYASTSNYDAIVLDILLPRVNGLEVCRRVRAGGSLTPILMLTARDTLDDKVAGLDHGADDYLTKPFELSGAPGTATCTPAPQRIAARRSAPRGRSDARSGLPRGSPLRAPDRPDQT